MRVGELISKIEQCKASTPLKDQTVEVVMGSKKYFICEIDNSADSLVCKVTRKNYRMMGHREFVQALERGNSTASCLFADADGGGEPKPISSVFLSPNYLELSTDVASS